MMKSSLFESPKPYLFVLDLKKQHSTTFNICQDSLKSVNLLYKWGLVATGVGTTVRSITYTLATIDAESCSVIEIQVCKAHPSLGEVM